MRHNITTIISIYLYVKSYKSKAVCVLLVYSCLFTFDLILIKYPCHFSGYSVTVLQTIMFTSCSIKGGMGGYTLPTYKYIDLAVI